MYAGLQARIVFITENACDSVTYSPKAKLTFTQM